MHIEPTEAACGAFVTGLDLSQNLTDPQIAQLRQFWINHKVLIFPDQTLENEDLERLTINFGGFGDDPFFEPIDTSDHIAAIERHADETTPIFAEVFHSDWSFLPTPPDGTMLYSLTIPPIGGNTLFADQVKAYDNLPDRLKDQADQLIAVHSARLGYSKDGAYGDSDKESGRSMKIIASDTALEEQEHPFVRIHPETGEKALYSSPAYIIRFKGKSDAESQLLLMEFYQAQTDATLVYSHQWQPNMLVLWDNRSTLHSATGGYDGYDRLLHRTTIAGTRF